MPARGGSFAWTEDARFPLGACFSTSVLKTVTASEKYPGGPGWERASAAFAWGGSPGPGQRGRATRSAFLIFKGHILFPFLTTKTHFSNTNGSFFGLVQ